jgi:hypothetical protein
MTEERSPIYTNPILYNLVMRILYGRHFEDRYQALANEIPDGAHIIDLCCGDCYIYTHYLRRKQVDYLGLDLAPRFIQSARSRGTLARQFDVWNDPIPIADIVMMQASLYQFIPHADQILGRMLASARQKVLIAEPVKNLSSSNNPLLAFIGRLGTRPGAKAEAYAGKRFVQQSLTGLFNATGMLEKMFFIPGEREMIGVFSVKRQASFSGKPEQLLAD